jgi:FixJ family two-component response regulator
VEQARPFIAIVDDEQAVRRALVRLLRASRIDAEAFATGEAFLNSLKVREPDCLILDLQMAGLTGRDLQRLLASAHSRFPVIILTAYDEPSVREQCIADGAAAYLRKPLRSDILLASIEAAID